MSNRFYTQFHALVLLALALCMALFTPGISFSAETYTIPQTAEVKLAWDANDPAPEGYCIYQRKEGEVYDYSQPCWTGSATTGTVYNLDWDVTYYFVVRAYAGTQQSADSEEVSYFSRSPETTTYSLTATAGQHGSISPGSTTIVAEGSDQTFTISPDAGYHVEDVAVDGASMGAISLYTFSYVTADHTINASFAIDTHIISSAAGSNGSISPSGNVTVDHNSSQQYAIIPNAGFHIADVLVDGVSIGSVSSYTFNQVTENHSISAVFSVDSHTISASAGNNGSITPTGGVKVDHGSSQTFSILPNDGYHVEEVLVDGISVGAIGGYTFSDVTADHAIHTTFAQDVIVVNQPPTADAGPDQTVEEAKEVRLSGSNSIDFDDGIASYQWRQTQGPEVALKAPDRPETTFTAPNVDTAGASLVFELAVTDYNNATTVDTCIVNVTWVNIPPTADAGGEQSVSEGMLVTLDAANSVDPDDGIVAYHWQQLQGPAVTLSESQSSTVSFNAPDTGTEGASLTFQLTVIDAGGLQDSDTCLVTVAWVNTPPLADAGPDQQVNIGDEVTLDGSLSTDADSDMLVSYRWRQTDGVPVELSDATAEKPSFEAPDVGNEGGILRFELTVEDSGGLLSKDTCEVVVAAPAETGVDTTPPTLTIGNPASDSVTIWTSSIDMSGSARDDQGVEKVVWKNNRGGSGVAAGTTQWQIQDISLKYGTNVVTITAIDPSGNSTSISKTVVVLYRWWWWWRR